MDKEATLNMSSETMQQVRAERDALQKEVAALKKELRTTEEALAQLRTSHHEYESKLAEHGVTIKKEYQYKEGECRPVPMGGVCEVCGWDRATQMKPGDKMKESHPLA